MARLSRAAAEVTRMYNLLLSNDNSDIDVLLAAVKDAKKYFGQ